MKSFKSYLNYNDFDKSSEKRLIEDQSSKILPNSVALSWESVTIKADVTSLKQSILDKIKPDNRVKKYHYILKEANGIVNSGEMLALMGPSGSGKTSLLNALNFHNKNLKVTGRIKINGSEVDSKSLALLSSYVQQEDLFFGTMTVKEHLIFHAMLRMDKNVTEMAKLRRVNQVIKEFNLENSADVFIGIHGKTKGISGGEKKRLSFATEILTDPPLLFCDEPTSGLDSFMAKSTIHYLKKLTNSGKTIICTIHQPSSETYKIFDKVCLLSEQRVAFFGSKENAFKFFTKSLFLEFPSYTNPADFFMDNLGIDTNDLESSKLKVQKYCEVFAKSQYNQELMEKINYVPVETIIIDENCSVYNSKWSHQLKYLLKRSFSNYTKNYQLMCTDLGMSITTALIGGLIFYHIGKMKDDGTCSFNQRSIRETSFALFFTLFVVSVYSVLSAIIAFPLEIPIYFKEHYSSVYRSDSYYFSKIITELPLNIIFPALTATILYYNVVFGCSLHNFLMFLFIIILAAIANFSLGHLFSILSTDISMAVGLATPTLATQLLFSGFFLDKTSNHPSWLNMFRYLSVFNYSFELLLKNQWEEVSQLECEYDIEVLCIAAGKDVLHNSSVSEGSISFNVIMILIITIVTRMMTYLVLWYRGKRNSFSVKRQLRKINANISV